MQPPSPLLATVVVRLPVERIIDWATFHATCAETFGFPDFYGRNMDAWIDCMSDVRLDTGMTRFLLRPNEQLVIELRDANVFRERLPDVFNALVECTAFVNGQFARSLPPLLLSLVSSE